MNVTAVKLKYRLSGIVRCSMQGLQRRYDGNIQASTLCLLERSWVTMSGTKTTFAAITSFLASATHDLTQK